MMKPNLRIGKSICYISYKAFTSPGARALFVADEGPDNQVGVIDVILCNNTCKMAGYKRLKQYLSKYFCFLIIVGLLNLV